MALLLTCSSAMAELPSELKDVVFTGDLNARSSVDFRKNARNVVSHIPEGSKGSVLEARKLKSTGSYGIKIKVTELGKGKTTAKVGDEVWVYYAQKDPWLSFTDKNDEDVEDPEEALVAKARRDGEGIPVPGTVAKPELPTQEEVLKQQKSEDPNLAKSTDKTKTEASFCDNCTEFKKAAPEIQNQQDIKDVRDAVTATAPKEKTDKTKTVAKKNTKAGKWANFPEVVNFSEGKTTAKTISYARRNKSRHSTGYCYKAVKRAHLASGAIKKYPPGVHAKDAVRDLKRLGMINMLDNPTYRSMIKSPDDAPKGAVIVYATSDVRQSGDTQIKTDWGSSGTYVSDFETPNNFLKSPKARRFANNGKPYKIIGVMIKP
ncbi:MAG: hypothetical protein J7501_14190 [Bdellovibrio sp.]|nr:hypothetical protein [Bdellovibrio sp.]